MHTNADHNLPRRVANDSLNLSRLQSLLRAQSRPESHAHSSAQKCQEKTRADPILVISWEAKRHHGQSLTVVELTVKRWCSVSEVAEFFCRCLLSPATPRQPDTRETCCIITNLPRYKWALNSA